MLVLKESTTIDSKNDVNKLNVFTEYPKDMLEKYIIDLQKESRDNKTKLLSKIVVFSQDKYMLFRSTKNKSDVLYCDVDIKVKNISNDPDGEQGKDKKATAEKGGKKKLSAGDQESLYKEWCEQNKRIPVADEMYNDFPVGKYYHNLVSSHEKTEQLLRYVKPVQKKNK